MIAKPVMAKKYVATIVPKRRPWPCWKTSAKSDAVVRLGAVFGGKTFRQDKIEQDHIHGCKRSGEIERRCIGNVAHDATDHRTKGKAETEGRANHAHRAGTILRRADIGNVSLRRGDVAASRAIDDACDEEESERRGPPHDEKTDRRAGQTHDQNRTPPEAIGKATEDGDEDDLHPGIDAGEPADLGRRGVEVFRVERQHRDDDAKSHHVDEDGEEDEEERRHG